MNRQRLILSILLVLLLSALVWGYLNRPRQKTVNSLKNAPGVRAQTVRKQDAPPTSAISGNVLRLDLLDREQPLFKGYHRNIFKPVFVDELKMMQKAAAVKPVPPPVHVQKPAPVLPVVMPEPPRRELARFTFLGFLKKDNRKTIFLSKDKDIFLVRVRDVMAGRYEATSLTDQALTILVRDSGEEIVIPLLENRALGAVK